MSFKIKYSVIIALLAIYLPFEVLLLKYLPVSDQAYSLMRFIPEVVIYLLLGTKVLQNIYNRKWIPKTPIDRVLLLFLISAIISIAANAAPLLHSLVGMRPLLRYVALFYLVASIDIPAAKVKTLVFTLIGIGALQCVIAGFQHFTGISQFFYPRPTDLEVAGVQAQYKMLETGFHSGREQGVGIGTFGDSVLLALFLVFITVISYCVILKMKMKTIFYRFLITCIFLVSLVGLFFTYSRVSVMIAVMAIPIILFIERRIKKLFFMGLVFSILLINIFLSVPGQSGYYNPKSRYTNPIANITSIFSESYIENNMKHSRGWILSDVGGSLIQTLNLFGYGPPGDETLDRMIKEDVISPLPFKNVSVINDVYWVALLGYFGFIGVALYLFILWKLYKSSLFVYRNSSQQIYIVLGLSLAVITILSIPYTFVIRTWVFRPFGFYFWLLAGLIVAEYRRIKMKEQQNNLNQAG